MSDLTAIILAAGKGSRIGAAKWQLLYQGKTFLDTIVTKLSACGILDILCVVQSTSIPDCNRVKLIINPEPEQEMLSSIYYGVKGAPLSKAYLIFPVDFPLVSKETINSLRA
jgi:CTP:molybdopterin cytidylyltransferase MocA